jgi:hypothetical protein
MKAYTVTFIHKNPPYPGHECSSFELSECKLETAEAWGRAYAQPWETSRVSFNGVIVRSRCDCGRRVRPSYDFCTASGCRETKAEVRP